MKKTERWKLIRVQRKREKRRIGKKNNPSYSGRVIEESNPLSARLFGWLSRPVPEEAKKDRRERNGQQGDR